MAGASDAKAGSGVIEGLTKLFPSIAGLKVASDAPQHMQFIMKLEQAILSYVQQDAQKKAQMQAQAAQQATTMGMGGGMPGGAPGGMPGMPQGGMPGMPPSPVAPGGGAGAMGGMGPAAAGGADELRRILAGPAAVGG